MAPVGQVTASGALAGALQRNRESLNSRFEYFTKVLRKPVDAEEFAIHLMENVAPVAEAVAAIDAAKVDKTVEELFGLSLELMGGGYIGIKARRRWPETLFRELFPSAAPHIAQEPRLVAGSLLNAVIAMEDEHSSRPGEWVGRMKSAATAAATVKDFLDAGMALSWRCGMAHYREGALSLIESAPESLALSLFGGACPATPANRAELMGALSAKWPPQANPGVTDNRKPVAVAGGFTGFNGPFAAPPEVYLEDGAITAGDGVNTFGVYADQFGSTVIRRPAGPYPAKIPVQNKETEKFVTQACPALRAVRSVAKSWAWDGATLAVTLTVSHKIFIFALSRP
jgi:hypothetical protein